MKYFDFRIEKPTKDIIAIVYNVKGFMPSNKYTAAYHHKYDIWQWINDSGIDCPPLDITHYFPLPDPPPLI